MRFKLEKQAYFVHTETVKDIYRYALSKKCNIRYTKRTTEKLQVYFNYYMSAYEQNLELIKQG